MAIDTEKVTGIMKEQDENVEYIMSVARTTAGKYTEHLDTIMQELYKKIIKSDEVPTEEIERNFLELTNLIYFMSDKLENLGAYDDISKANAKEAYNKAYLTEQNNTDSNKKKPTVAELTAVAEQESKYETVVNNVYATAYAIVKAKVQSAQEMSKALSKIMSKRIAEMQMSTIPTNE